jgi:hypothetical protein
MHWYSLQWAAHLIIPGVSRQSARSQQAGFPPQWYCSRSTRAVTIVDAEQLGGVMLERLAELFDEHRGANTRVRSRRAASL